MPLKTVQRRIAGNTDVPTDLRRGRRRLRRPPTSRPTSSDLLRERRGIGPANATISRVLDMAQIASDADQRHRRAHRPAVGGRRRQPAGRRHRHHEHHAGLGHRADARDRHPPGHRRARPARCCMQFLVEAVVLSLFGGIIGIAARLRPVGGRRAASSACRSSRPARSSPSPSSSRRWSASSSAISRPAAPPASTRSRRCGTNRRGRYWWPEAPFTRRRSASAIVSASVRTSIWGRQPSFVSALAGLPRRWSISAGRQ